MSYIGERARAEGLPRSRYGAPNYRVPALIARCQISIVGRTTLGAVVARLAAGYPVGRRLPRISAAHSAIPSGSTSSLKSKCDECKP